MTYTGTRVSALLKFNDDWNLLLQQNYQNMEADGYFAEYPVAPDGASAGSHTRSPRSRRPTTRTNTRARPGRSTAGSETSGQLWRPEGGLHRQLYGPPHRAAGGLFELRAQRDGLYYACIGVGCRLFISGTGKPTTCYAPVGTWNDNVKNTHQSHEIRLSTNGRLPVSRPWSAATGRSSTSRIR